MDGNNTGPVARLVRLPQGHYRRVVSDEVPEFLKDVKVPEQIFEDLRFCCSNTCLVTEEEYNKLMPNTEIYTDDVPEILQNVTENDEAEVFYQMYTNKTFHDVAEIGVQTTQRLKSTLDVAVGQTKAFDAEEESTKGSAENKAEQLHDVPEVVLEHIETEEEKQQKREKQVAMTERLAKFGGPTALDVNKPDPFKGEGVPTLFYTKSRLKPTLVMMSMDYEMNVIYMIRNNISRFFPVKLISRLVTNPDIIQEEFTKQVEADPEIKLNYMVLINAANFTDSVAIQFPDPILKDRFVEELKQLKNEIRTQAAGCPELESFIVSKYDPLLTIVKELNENLQHLERENLRLERRIINLEQCLADGGAKQPAESADLQAPSVVHTIEEESALSPPWLFSCQTGTAISTLQVLLEFNPASTMELDVSTWSREENMWISFMEEVPPLFNIKVDLKEMVDLQAMRRVARRVLMDLAQNEVMIVLRNVPGKDEATTNATSITLVAILASAISEAWKRVEYTTPQNMGRICLILEGENIGSRLRAGTKKFRIEPLN